MGAVEAARAIEPLCMLWCIPGVGKGDWSPHAFKLLQVGSRLHVGRQCSVSWCDRRHIAGRMS